MIALRCRMFKQVIIIPYILSRTSAGPSRADSGSYVRSAIKLFFNKRLVVTNSITSGGFMALGDMIHQEYEFQTKAISERYEWRRMKRMAIVGFFLGYMHHYYYYYLDVLIPRISVKTVIIKVALDQFVCAPLTIVSFFYLMGTLEMKSLSESSDELLRKFKMVYAGDCLFWPPIQCINFYFVPSTYRVFYVNAATMVFDVFLSLMKHYDRPS